jgi:hypothetical protein
LKRKKVNPVIKPGKRKYDSRASSEVGVRPRNRSMENHTAGISVNLAVLTVPAP